MFEKWGFRSPMGEPSSTSEWHGHLVWPGGQQLYDALFDDGEPIEWNRACSKDASMLRGMCGAYKVHSLLFGALPQASASSKT
jgi:hypothetical protein